ncbi:fatty acid desaturase [Sporobolomyces salmoneus]|uniref:fatty acid desaturase n=1 Tax=Sporobolomyces salmoneus TaxID=183962 RepID=UPI00316FD7F3
MASTVDTKSESPSSRFTAASSRDSSLLPCPGVPLPSNFDKLPFLSRSEISSRICRGELLIIHSPLVYRVPHNWLKLHPGGDHSLLHYVGRDAGCEIEAYHTGKTVKERMGRWVVGKVEVDEGEFGEGWRDMTPPIQLGMWPIPVPKITVSEPTTMSDEDLMDSTSEEEDEKPTKSNTETTATRHLTPGLVDPPLSTSDYSKLPLHPVYQAHLRRSHRRLHSRIHSLGLDTTPSFLSGYAPSLFIYTTLLSLSIYTYVRATTTFDYFLAAVCLGAFWHQITFVAHDTGHSELTGSWWADRLWGVAIADFMGGLSIGWWCDNHNVHHLVTNSPEHDPDIQHLPFFAISNKFFASLRSTYYNRIMALDGFARYVLPYQHRLYYIVMCFARFNLFALSYSFVLTKWPAKESPLFKLRVLELVGISMFWIWFSKVLFAIDTVPHRFLYLLVSFAVTSPLHVQIVLSHFSQPISILPPSVSPSSLPIPLSSVELLESHPHRQLRTTMDISCPPYLDFLHGGLNFQTPHHLLPRIPRFRFRQVAELVSEWVEEENRQISIDEKSGKRVWRGRITLGENEGLVYKKMSFVEGNKSVLGVLKDVADQARLLVRVAEKEAKGELEHH